jgi:hypothetical protein
MFAGEASRVVRVMGLVRVAGMGAAAHRAGPLATRCGCALHAGVERRASGAPRPRRAHRPRTGAPLGRRNMRGPQRLTGITLSVTLNGAVTGAAHASSAGAHAHADVLVGAHPRSLGPPCRGVHRGRRRPRRRMEPKFSAARSANMNQPLPAPETHDRCRCAIGDATVRMMAWHDGHVDQDESRPPPQAAGDRPRA